MSPRCLTWLEWWILCWLQADAQRSKALLAASYQQLLGGFARQERQQIRASLAYLETKRLIVVGRTPGGKATYLWLTAAGSQYVSRVPRRLEV